MKQVEASNSSRRLQCETSAEVSRITALVPSSSTFPSRVPPPLYLSSECDSEIVWDCVCVMASTACDAVSKCADKLIEAVLHISISGRI